MGRLGVHSKFDKQEAYDSVKWRFVERVLTAMRFPAQMIRWIMLCVSTPSYSVSYERMGRRLFSRGHICLCVFGFC